MKFLFCLYVIPASETALSLRYSKYNVTSLSRLTRCIQLVRVVMIIRSIANCEIVISRKRVLFYSLESRYIYIQELVNEYNINEQCSFILKFV